VKSPPALILVNVQGKKNASPAMGAGSRFWESIGGSGKNFIQTGKCPNGQHVIILPVGPTFEAAYAFETAYMEVLHTGVDQYELIRL
jgi:hypothetical protein